MHALRFPLAACLGLFVSLAVFTLLWTFIGRATAVGPPVVSHDVKFTRQLVDTPVQPKRPERPEKLVRPTERPLPTTPALGPNDKSDARTERASFAAARFEPYNAVVELRRVDHAAMGQDREVIPIVRIAPDYPPKPLLEQIEGWVKVQFTIAPSGSVRDAFVVESNPKDVFDASALKAIARWRYNPKIEDGVAVERVGVQTVIRFQLQ
jgi:periplasmic protein TonB